MKRSLQKILPLLLLLISSAGTAICQTEINLNMGLIDGQELTPDNVLSFQVQSTLTKPLDATIKGSVRYRTGQLFFNYQFNCTIMPGINTYQASAVHPQWQFSSAAFREIFETYKKMPEGTYEYCINVLPRNIAGETNTDPYATECLYQQALDVFLINLVDPEDKAKIHEFYPALSWSVNYPFASALTYRIRVAEIKEGQNTQGAISRNNPQYQESNLTATSQVYPSFAKPLELWHSYAWTVDAYYKGILIGGAEPWKFTLVDDSLLATIPKDQSYIDIRMERSISKTYAIGQLKLKYVLKDLKTDTLSLSLTRDGKDVPLRNKVLLAKNGDNRFELSFNDQPRLKHLATYILRLTNLQGEQFNITFIYFNPDFLN